MWSLLIQTPSFWIPFSSQSETSRKVLALLGNLAALFRDTRNLGHQLCAPPFREVCLFRAMVIKKASNRHKIYANLAPLLNGISGQEAFKTD